MILMMSRSKKGRMRILVTMSRWTVMGMLTMSI
jgi:hypothetical protein